MPSTDQLQDFSTVYLQNSSRTSFWRHIRCIILPCCSKLQRSNIVLKEQCKSEQFSTTYAREECFLPMYVRELTKLPSKLTKLPKLPIFKNGRFKQRNKISMSKQVKKMQKCLKTAKINSFCLMAHIHTLTDTQHNA